MEILTISWVLALTALLISLRIEAVVLFSISYVVLLIMIGIAMFITLERRGG